MKMDLKLHLFGLLLILPVTPSIIFNSDAADFISVDYKSVVRMGVSMSDYSKLVITAKPLLMVSGGDRVDKTRVSIETRAGGGQWLAVATQPSVRGGVYVWVVGVAPCTTHQVRLWLHGKDRTQASYLYPTVVGVVSSEELGSAGYRPPQPRGVSVVEREGRVELRWLPALCADLYDITYTQVTAGQPYSAQALATDRPAVTLMQGIQSCSEYEFKIAAVTGAEFSEDTTGTFITQPEVMAAAVLEPELVPTTAGITVRWAGYEKLSCIQSYTLTICKEGNDCPEKRTIERDDSLEFLEFVSTHPLAPCSDYTLHLAPVFPGLAMQEKVLSFRTLALPLATALGTTVTRGRAEVGQDLVVRVEWDSVQCATHYTLYQREDTPGGEWERVCVTSKTYAEHIVRPCTQYSYGLRVTVGEEESHLIELAGPVISQLDTAVPYSPHSLEISETPGGAVVSWEHSKCVESYRLRACHRAGDQCYEEQVTISDSNTISHTITSLHPCTDYTLHIFPSTSAGEFSAASALFSTTSPAPHPPADIDVVITRATHGVLLSWSGVACATGYNIHQKLQHSGTVTQWRHDNTGQLAVTLESPEPCVTYSYSISTLIDSEESDPTSWLDVPVPPRFDQAEQLIIQTRANGSLTFSIENIDKNQKCEVEKYSVKYEGVEEYIDPDDTHEGEITVKVDSENAKIEARIKYKGFEEWSHWISSEIPVS